MPIAGVEERIRQMTWVTQFRLQLTKTPPLSDQERFVFPDGMVHQWSWYAIVNNEMYAEHGFVQPDHKEPDSVRLEMLTRAHAAMSVLNPNRPKPQIPNNVLRLITNPPEKPQ